MFKSPLIMYTLLARFTEKIWVHISSLLETHHLKPNLNKTELTHLMPTLDLSTGKMHLKQLKILVGF